MRARLCAIVCTGVLAIGCQEQAPAPSTTASGGQRGAPEAGVPRKILELTDALAPQREVTAREGVAAAILIDTSGSMDRRAGGRQAPMKIEVARRAALDLVAQFARYAADHPNEPVMLGIYEFSGRDGLADCREIIAMGPPDRLKAAEAVMNMRAKGGTPIGDAMVAGKLALDATGLSRRHLLVITDGENTTGAEPEDVATAIGRRPDTERPSMYFVAFDIEASRFNAVRDAGAMVLGAATGKELGETLNALLRGQILIEK